MSNNLITINDFENICRTCLSKVDLKPLHEKCLSEKLTFCTSVKFAAGDGLPAKICINCIHEINQAFSFAKHCEITDAILRKCLIKTEFANDLFESQKVEPIIKAEEEMKSEIIFPNTSRLVQEVFENFKYIDVKQEENAKLEFKPVIMHQTAEEVKVKIEYEECADEVEHENNVNLENQAETYQKTDDTSSSRCRHKISLDSSSMNPCSVCSKVFTTCSKLKMHMRIHTGEKPYSCKVCSKSFTRFSSLINHMSMHAGEKPYSCKVCSNAFRSTGNLKYHMRKHTGEKPYKCEVCNKEFTQTTSLDYHKRIHTGEKPYSCKVCTKAFRCPSNLKIHEKTLRCKALQM